MRILSSNYKNQVYHLECHPLETKGSLSWKCQLLVSQWETLGIPPKTKFEVSLKWLAKILKLPI